MESSIRFPSKTTSKEYFFNSTHEEATFSAAEYLHFHLLESPQPAAQPWPQSPVHPRLRVDLSATTIEKNPTSLRFEMDISFATLSREMGAVERRKIVRPPNQFETHRHFPKRLSRLHSLFVAPGSRSRLAPGWLLALLSPAKSRTAISLQATKLINFAATLFGSVFTVQRRPEISSFPTLSDAFVFLLTGPRT
jgi:hypothetical protein